MPWLWCSHGDPIRVAASDGPVRVAKPNVSTLFMLQHLVRPVRLAAPQVLIPLVWQYPIGVAVPHWCQPHSCCNTLLALYVCQHPMCRSLHVAAPCWSFTCGSILCWYRLYDMTPCVHSIIHWSVFCVWRDPMCWSALPLEMALKESFWRRRLKGLK